MNPTIHAAITERLFADYGFKQKSANGVNWLRQGLCPNCNTKELYTHYDHPWTLRCGRQNKCAWEGHVRELYPELFNSWGDRFPVTPENPNAAADAYLHEMRGFDLAKIRGCYSQENYFDHELKAGSATVRFPLAGVGYWERIIDKPERFGSRKASFRGSFKGTWWQPPGLQIVQCTELWVVEGIFDAIALMHHGIAVVSTLSCNNYPDKALAALALARQSGVRPALIFAYDTDKAGEYFTKKYVELATEQGWKAAAAQIPQNNRAKIDWNDCHQRGRLTVEDIDEYRYHGDLLLAKNADEKGRLMFSHDGYGSFHFDFEKRLYWYKLLEDKKNEGDAGRDSGYQIKEICNCLPRPLYYLKNEITDDAWYYFRIDFPHGGASVKCTFTAGQIAATAEFKKRLLHSGAGAIWSGTSGQLDALLNRWTYGIKTVDTVDFIGYSGADHHKCYVFNDVAVQGSRIFSLNDEDYFDMGKLAIKSLSKSPRLELPDAKTEQVEWFEQFYLCFGTRGIVALSFWLGSLFAEQIRKRFESFPFIEIVGEPGAGKTTLLEMLWKLLGRGGYEGFDPQKGSSVGFLRSMAQVSNLPVVLIESDRDDGADGSRGRGKSVFHWDSLKSLYNGGSLRTTGVKSASNDTYEPQFRAALVISQNAPVQASTPIMERIIHLYFDKNGQSNAGREAALELGRLQTKTVSGFLLKAVTRAANVIQLMDENHRKYEEFIEKQGVKNQRIQKNHAQIMVCLDALMAVCPVTKTQRDDAMRLLVNLAKERQEALAIDHPIVEQFWEAFEFLNNDDGTTECDVQLNHSSNPEHVAVNLNHFIQISADKRQQVPLLNDLKRFLKTSRRYKFIDANRPVRSVINNRWNARNGPHNIRPVIVKCWIFENPDYKKGEDHERI